MPNASPPDPVPLTLERLLSPLTPAEFFERYWEERYLILRREDPSRYEGLFSFADVDRYLAIAAGHPSSHISLVQAGQPVQRVRLADIPPSRIYAAFHGGATILLEGVDLCWPPLAALSAALRRALSARIHINAYVTPPGAQGAHLHPDIQDVFAVQLEGKKEWWIYAERVHEPTEHLSYTRYLTDPSVKAPYERDEAALPLAEKTILAPGDLLYLPRGVVHKAVASQGAPSLHLSIGVTPVYWADVLKAAIEVATVRRPALCRALPPGFERRGTGELAAALRPAFREVLELLAEGDAFERTLDVLRRAQAAATPYAGDGHFEQILRVEEIGPETWLERRAIGGLVVSVSGDAASIQFGDAEVRGPKDLAPALGYIRDHHRFQVSDLPGPIAAKTKVVLAKRLVREGLLRAVRDDNP